MKTMTKFMFSALCAAAMVTSVSAQGGKDMLSNGIKYLDVPYVAHTLEADGPEELVINCDEVDCTTLVEYVLAETLTPKLADGDISESAFADNLQKIRYRDGKIDGYTSRLHYIADWINNGVRNGFLQDVTGAMSPDTERLSISYMSSHPQLYKVGCILTQMRRKKRAVWRRGHGNPPFRMRAAGSWRRRAGSNCT